MRSFTISTICLLGLASVVEAQCCNGVLIGAPVVGSPVPITGIPIVGSPVATPGIQIIYPTCVMPGEINVGGPVVMAPLVTNIASPGLNGITSTNAAPNSILGMLNGPLIPGIPAVSTVPGIPNLSILGLLSPRLSYGVNLLNSLSNPKAFTTNLVGMFAPRIAPVIGLMQSFPPTTTQLGMSGLAIVSPRAATLVSTIQAYQQSGQNSQGGSGRGLFVRRCR